MHLEAVKMRRADPRPLSGGAAVKSVCSRASGCEQVPRERGECRHTDRHDVISHELCRPRRNLAEPRHARVTALEQAAVAPAATRCRSPTLRPRSSRPRTAEPSTSPSRADQKFCKGAKSASGFDPFL